MPKFLVTTTILLVIAVSLILLNISNFSGYCDEIGRPLTEEELIRRVAGPIYEENPYCCELYNLPDFDGNFDNYLSRFFGHYSNRIDMYYKQNEAEEGAPYYHKMVFINACGKPIDTFGIGKSEKLAKTIMKSIKRRKEEKNNGQ
ncbi:MAG: hypothetical protein MK052_12375 [Alphaproteobacteria bacterium]|nr:hypothetical protein [Alphaproteobacteria bacterium]